MITRKATLLDLARLAEAVQPDLVSAWCIRSRENQDYLTVVTVHRGQILAALLAQIVPISRTLEINLLWLRDGEKLEIVDYVLQRATQYAQEQCPTLEAVILTDRVEKWEYMDRLGFKPTVVTYVLALNQENKHESDGQGSPDRTDGGGQEDRGSSDSGAGGMS